MKTLTTLLTLIALLSGSGLHAQTGSAAASSRNVAKGNTWQNWVFAGSALVTAAVGVFVVSMNSGSTPSGQSH